MLHAPWISLFFFPPQLWVGLAWLFEEKDSQNHFYMFLGKREMEDKASPGPKCFECPKRRDRSPTLPSDTLYSTGTLLYAHCYMHYHIYKKQQGKDTVMCSDSGRWWCKASRGLRRACKTCFRTTNRYEEQQQINAALSLRSTQWRRNSAGSVWRLSRQFLIYKVKGILSCLIFYFFLPQHSTTHSCLSK